MQILHNVFSIQREILFRAWQMRIRETSVLQLREDIEDTTSDNVLEEFFDLMVEQITTHQDYHFLHQRIWGGEINADLTVACIEVPIRSATELGVMAIDNESCIVGFEEKPDQPKPTPNNPDLTLASMGIYIFNTEVLVRQLSDDAKRNSDHDFGKNIIPSMVDSDRVFAYNFKDGNRNSTVYWRDIGLLDAYWEANMDLVSEIPEFDLHAPDWPVRTYTRPYPPSRLHLDTKTSSPLVVAQSCVIVNAQIQRSVISAGVHIDTGAQITDSVLMEGVRVGAHTELHRIIADEGVIIPANAQIGVDPASDRQRFTVTEGGVVAIRKGLPIE